MTLSLKASAVPTLSIADLARCTSCSMRLTGDLRCPRCEKEFAVRDGILDAIGPLAGRNSIVAAFYDGRGWVRFRPFEQGFLMLQGGVRRARMEILRHLLRPDLPCARGLEVGIGAGENTAPAR